MRVWCYMLKKIRVGRCDFFSKSSEILTQVIINYISVTLNAIGDANSDVLVDKYKKLLYLEKYESF